MLNLTPNDQWVVFSGGKALRETKSQSLEIVLSRRPDPPPGGRRALVIPASYATPAISVQRALELATAFVEEERLRHNLPDDFTSPVPDGGGLREDEPFDRGLYYRFVSTSDSLIKLGIVPGAIICRVDRLDGHLWSDREEQDFLTATGQGRPANYEPRPDETE